MKVSKGAMSTYMDYNLSRTNNRLDESQKRLSSGLRINSAKDDAAGLMIANQLMAQMRGLSIQTRNASDAISVAQVAEGGMQTSQDMLLRMRDLALQSANGALGPQQRQALDAEFQSLQTEMRRQQDTVAFGSQKLNQAAAYQGLFDDPAKAQEFVAGQNAAMSQIGGIHVASSGAAQQAIGRIDSAMEQVSMQRAQLGAAQNALEHRISQQEQTRVNVADAQSRIRDLDYAMESTQQAKQQIMLRTGAAMKVQANSQTLFLAKTLFKV
jgi:flagellin